MAEALDGSLGTRRGGAQMSGWLIAKPYEVDGGLPTHESLVAVWHEDRQVALEMAQRFSPRGSAVVGRIVTALGDSVLRGLKVQPGGAAMLHADQPWI